MSKSVKKGGGKKCPEKISEKTRQKAEEIVKLLRTEEVLTVQDWPGLIRAFDGREVFI